MATLAQLSYFVEVCDCPTMTRAAERLHISQPAITKAIKDLEREYGVQLIIRSKTGHTVTSAGKILYEHAQQVLASADSLENAMRRARGEKQTLRAGTSILFAKLFPGFFKEFKASHPDIDASNYVFGSNELMRYLEDGSLDVAVFGVTKGIKAYSKILSEHEVCLWVNRDNPLAALKVVNLDADFGNTPIIVFTESAPGISDTKSAGQPTFLSYLSPDRIAMHTNQLGTVREALQKNSAVALLPKGILDDCEDLVAIPVVPAFRFSLAAYWTSNSADSAMVDFVNSAQTYMRAHR